MSGSRNASLDVVEKYVQGAINFSRVIAQSEDDKGFAASDDTYIHYFFDADVVALYLDPVKHRRYVSAFPNEDAHLTNLISVVTGEFLFSAELSGQRGVKPVITPDHAFDVMSMSGEIQRKLLLQDWRDDEDNEQLRRAIDNAGKLARRFSDVTSASDLMRLGEELFAPLENTLFTPIKEAARLNHVFVKLLDAATSRAWFHSGVLEPNRSDANQLATWIEDQKKTDNAEIRRQNILRDARSIVQVQTLAGDANPLRERFVLVSGDEGMHAAYDSWYLRTLEARGLPYILRRPRQYIPLINLHTRKNHDSDGEKLLGHVKDAIADLTLGFESRHRGTVYDVVRASPGGPESSKELGDVVAKLLGTWRELAEHSLLGSLHLLAKEQVPELSVISDELEGTQLQEAVHRAVESVLRGVTRVHLTMGAQGSLMRYVFVSATRGPSPERRAARAPLAIRSQILAPLIGDDDINDLLQNLSDDDQGNVYASLQHRLSSATQRHLTTFFAACICLRTSEWAAARHYASQARRILRLETRPLASSTSGKLLDDQAEDVIAEFRYVQALATRLELADYKSFVESKRLLGECVKYHEQHKQFVTQARAHSEAAALALMCVASFRFSHLDRKTSSGRGVVQVDEQKIFESAEKHLSDAQRLIDNAGLRDRAEKIYATVELQVLANRASAAVYKVIFLRQPFERHRPTLLRLVSDLDRGMREHAYLLPPVVSVSKQTLEWLLSPSVTDSEERGNLLLDYLNKCLRFDKELLDVDRLKFQAIEKHVRESLLRYR